MIKIIFFDIDGTLRPFETGRVPASTQAALRRRHGAAWDETRHENGYHDRDGWTSYRLHRHRSRGKVPGERTACIGP